MEWNACAPAPLAWIGIRELLLAILFNPGLLLTLLGAFSFVVAWLLHLPRTATLFLSVLLPLAASVAYSPVATALLSAWLQQQLPNPPAPTAATPVVVLVGRGQALAAATTEAAASRLLQGEALAAYVSGDERATAERLLQLGAAPSQVAGDSCARTTWENATLTAAWLRQHHPDTPVLLITDPWQLPRATRAFQQQGLNVTPLAVAPSLTPAKRNRLALRETAATLLYGLQGLI